MWFGPEELFRQCVFLLDEEIIDYSQTPIPLICILRSSPAPVRLCSFELCNGKKKFPLIRSQVFIFTAAWRSWRFLNFKIRHEKCFECI